MGEQDLISALRLALTYVEKAAATNPTTPSRLHRKLQAAKDADTIRAALARATKQ